jgi:hypothetical protein
MPLSGEERTCLTTVGMSASSQKQTFGCLVSRLKGTVLLRR